MRSTKAWLHSQLFILLWNEVCLHQHAFISALFSESTERKRLWTHHSEDPQCPRSVVDLGQGPQLDLPSGFFRVRWRLWWYWHLFASFSLISLVFTALFYKLRCAGKSSLNWLCFKRIVLIQFDYLMKEDTSVFVLCRFFHWIAYTYWSFISIS